MPTLTSPPAHSAPPVRRDDPTSLLPKRLARSRPLFDPDIVHRAIRASFGKLNPLTLMKNALSRSIEDRTLAEADVIPTSTMQIPQEEPLAPIQDMINDALHHRATLSDAEFAALSAHYDDDKILEIILLCGFYRTVSYLANGLDLPLEEKAARFPN